MQLGACGDAALSAYSTEMVASHLRSPGSAPLSLAKRLGTLWAAKLVGTSVGMTLFFVAYFSVLHHPRVPPWTMPLTHLDKSIAAWPPALPVYLSLWIYVSLAPALLIQIDSLRRIAVGGFGLAVSGLTVFWVWPTRVAFQSDGPAADGAFGFLRTIDASGNACPSLHVAFAVFAAWWIERTFRDLRYGLAWRAGNWVWCAGIMYSTVAVRQHVVWDVVAGAALGAVIAALSLRSERREVG